MIGKNRQTCSIKTTGKLRMDLNGRSSSLQPPQIIFELKKDEQWKGSSNS